VFLRIVFNLSASLHGITTQKKNIDIFMTARTSNLHQLCLQSLLFFFPSAFSNFIVSFRPRVLLKNLVSGEMCGNEIADYVTWVAVRGTNTMNFELRVTASPPDGLRGDPCSTPSHRQSSSRNSPPYNCSKGCRSQGVQGKTSMRCVISWFYQKNWLYIVEWRDGYKW
jgi:hypothetical protein